MAECSALVHLDLTIVCQMDGVPLQRSGRWALEMDPIFVEAATMTGTLELLLRFQPNGGTAKMGTFDLQRVQLQTALEITMYDPDTMPIRMTRLHQTRRILVQAANAKT